MHFGADRAQKTLSDDRIERRDDEKRLNPHVHETSDRARRIVRVKGREHQVTGERGLNGDFGRFVIANFPDENRVRVLTKKGAKNAGESQPDVLIDLNLIDPFEIVLDRIFGGGKIVGDLVELGERRVKRRRFTATRGSGDENHPVRRVDPLFENLELLLLKSELHADRAEDCPC